MNLPHDLRNVLSSHNIERVRTAINQDPGLSQEELNKCLELAMPAAPLDILSLLLNKDAKLTATAFHKSIERHDPVVLQMLVNHGWDLDSTEFGMPAVQFAIWHEPSLRWLLEHGANPNTMSVRRGGSCRQCCTPLSMAAKLNDTTPLEILLSHGAEVDPLAIFSSIGVRGQKNGTSAMAVLVDHGADVNYVSNTWGTPLFHAVQWKNEEKLRYLLNHGADPTIRLKVTGMTPADLAIKRGQTELLEILQAAETSHTV